MTLAGNNIKVKIWRILYESDDSVGGAVVTGTYIGSYPARLQANPEEQLLLQQGLETERTFKINIVPGYLDIRERDELTVIAPTDHPYYNKWFRVRGVSYSSLNKRDPRNYMMLTVSISVRAHSDDAVLQEGTVVVDTTTTTTLLYDRILALTPLIFNTMGDSLEPMSDAMGYGGTMSVTGAAPGLMAYAQTGIESGHLCLQFAPGCAGIWSNAYIYAQTPTSKMSAGIYLKFISPYLDDVSSKVILRLCRASANDYIDIAKTNAANSISFMHNGGGTLKTITQTGVDYNWHSYFWTLSVPDDRFKTYYDGVLVGTATSLGAFTLGYAPAFLGGIGSAPTSLLRSYIQYHVMWASRELTQTEITGIATV